MKDMRGVRGEWDIVALGMTTRDLVYDPGSLLLLRSGPLYTGLAGKQSRRV